MRGAVTSSSSYKLRTDKKPASCNWSRRRISRDLWYCSCSYVNSRTLWSGQFFFCFFFVFL